MPTEAASPEGTAMAKARTAHVQAISACPNRGPRVFAEKFNTTSEDVYHADYGANRGRGAILTTAFVFRFDCGTR
jgi:hypothetical protein